MIYFKVGLLAALTGIGTDIDSRQLDSHSSNLGGLTNLGCRSWNMDIFSLGLP